MGTDSTVTQNKQVDENDTVQKGFRSRLIAAALGPFAAASVYLLLSRLPSYRFSTLSDNIALFISVVFGVVCVLSLPIRPLQRVLALLFYVPVIAMLLYFFSFLFIAVIFGEGL